MRTAEYPRKWVQYTDCYRVLPQLGPKLNLDKLRTVFCSGVSCIGMCPVEDFGSKL